MNRRALQIVLVAVLVAAAVLLRGRDRLPETPEAAVNAFFDAAGRGDDKTYLGLVSGALRTSLEETRSQLGAEKFREQLRLSAAKIKGLAISPAGAPSPDQAALDVVLVFEDRQEHQRFTLTPAGGGWAIIAMTTATAQQPKVRYGTPVFEE